MRLRTRCTIAAATAALCAALSGCGGKSADAADLPAPTPSATVSSDPFAFNLVPYLEYSDAARQTGIRPDLVAREFGFNDGLGTLCRATPADLTTLLATLKTAASSEDNAGYAVQAMIDEVSLRIDMACPQRMSDWIAAGGGSEHPGDDGYAAEPSVEEPETDETGAPTTEPTPSSVASIEPTDPEPAGEATESSFGQASFADLDPADISESGGEVRQFDLGDGDAAGAGTADAPSVEAPAP